MKIRKFIALGVIIGFYPQLSASQVTADHRQGEKDKVAHVRQYLDRVAAWQLDSIEHKGLRHAPREWTSATLFTGLIEMAKLSGGERYSKYLESIGQQFDWKVYSDKYRYYADNYCVGQLYAWKYSRDKNVHYIADFVRLADTLVSRPHSEPLAWKNNIALREWAWCDALFMGPPALSAIYKVTGNPQYLDLVDKLWWKTTDYLYNPKERLFYRDQSYFDKKESNGEAVFWSRGNGWVLAGLVRVLNDMPKAYKTRDKWEHLYRSMVQRVAALQQHDGYWRTSLLDPSLYPAKETSGTALFTYAIAWGINNKIIPSKDYEAVVWKGWQAISSAVHPDGKLGYVQQVGEAPGEVSYEDTEIYGVGAFLLAGNEVLKLAQKK